MYVSCDILFSYFKFVQLYEWLFIFMHSYGGSVPWNARILFLYYQDIFS